MSRQENRIPLAWAIIRLVIPTALACVSTFASSPTAVEISSNPPGARIEINGQDIGTTPYIWNIGSFALDPHKRWIGSKHLTTPLNMRLSMAGYVAKEIVLTGEPLVWTSINGQNHFSYYLVSSTRFDVTLEKIGNFVGENPFHVPPVTTAISEGGQSPIATPANAENVIELALAAVVQIRTAKGLGSGFLITSSGLIVTNRHVVNGADHVEVITSRGQSVSSSNIYPAQDRDLAIVKLDGGPYPWIPLARPESLRIGQDLIAIGSPRGLQNTVTKGTLSAFRKEADCSLIQTDTAINPGNSGGPLLNSKGEVVGVNTFRLEYSHDSGLNFAIHVGEVTALLERQFNFSPVLSVTSEEAKTVAIKTTPLKNIDIVSLKNAGLGDDLIIRKIHSSECSFDLNTSDLVSLHHAGISDPVIGVMVETRRMSK